MVSINDIEGGRGKAPPISQLDSLRPVIQSDYNLYYGLLKFNNMSDNNDLTPDTSPLCNSDENDLRILVGIYTYAMKYTAKERVDNIMEEAISHYADQESQRIEYKTALEKQDTDPDPNFEMPACDYVEEEWDPSDHRDVFVKMLETNGGVVHDCGYDNGGKMDEENPTRICSFMNLGAVRAVRSSFQMLSDDSKILIYSEMSESNGTNDSKASNLTKYKGIGIKNVEFERERILDAINDMEGVLMNYLEENELELCLQDSVFCINPGKNDTSYNFLNDDWLNDVFYENDDYDEDDEEDNKYWYQITGRSDSR